MPSQETKDWPLGLLTDSILGPLPFKNLDKEASELTVLNTRGLANWYRLTSWLVSYATSKAVLDTLLSPDQQRSHRLLWQWWTAVYQNPAVTLASILDIVSTSDNIEVFYGRSSDVWDIAIKHLQLRSWPKGDVIELSHYDPAEDSYNDILRRHWEWEFTAYSSVSQYKESMEARGNLDRSRLEAAVHAFCQLVATRCYANLTYDGQPQTRDPSGTTDDPKSSLSASEGFAFEEEVVDSMPIVQACMDIRVEYGPEIAACPWLETCKSSQDNLPYYLWNVVECRTVETAKLGFHPVYTAVSHTWGRWPKDTPCCVDGVPWLVPQNTRFQVEDLPTLLASIPTKTPFVWFDLVCIPQDRSVISVQEIARQAIIFKSANFVVAWLNDVASFDTLSSVIQWHALQLLEVCEGSEEDSHRGKLMEAAWQKIRGQECGLLECREDKLVIDNCKPNAWFTSLWTLQEIAMRPDMWLCSRNWECLTCDGISPLSFSGLITIHNQFFRRTSLLERLQAFYGPENEGHISEHLAVMELIIFRYLTGLDKIAILSRPALIALGDRRQCSEGRAVAIMSALGVTEWYEAATGGEHRHKKPYEEQKDSLVLGKYPLEFINEIRAKIPEEFFLSMINYNISSEQNGDICASSGKGTMLPFSGGETYFAQNTFQEIDLPFCHDSVASWTVLCSGGVLLPCVCLLSSPSLSLGARTELLPSKLQGVRTTDTPEVTDNLPRWAGDSGWIDLHQWLKAQSFEVYAVVVSFTNFSPNRGSNFCGIILKNISPGSFIKIGNFWVTTAKLHPIPETSEVNWLVL